MRDGDNYCSYSVLMSVYEKEKPSYLWSAMNSIWQQTVLTDNFILVCDGPLTPGLNEVIANMQRRHMNDLNVVRLENNLGLGKALNIGLKYCQHELVARMDSDDISRPERCEKQLRVFNTYSDIGICSGVVEEFSESIDVIEARRIPPETQKEILAFAKKRNPFNHPCVMYRKSLVENAGGYKDFFLLEDYYLWVRMLQKGIKGYNIQEPLLWMRAGRDLYKRRAGWRYVKSQIELFKYMCESGFIGRKQYYKSISIRLLSSLMPNSFRTLLFRHFMREM